MLLLRFSNSSYFTYYDINVNTKIVNKFLKDTIEIVSKFDETVGK